MSLVLDASVTISWMYAAERDANSRDVLRRAAAQGAIVPSLWRLEIANVLFNAVRRKRASKAYADQSLRRLTRLRITIDGETDERAWGSIRDLSAAHQLTPYDAAYLELAIRRGLPLATRDVALVKAAQSVGVRTLG